MLHLLVQRANEPATLPFCLLQGLASAIVTAALRSQAAPVAAPPTAHAMAAGSLAGAGRQLQAGTGRMVAWGGAAQAKTAGEEQLERQQHQPKLDLLSILLAPAAPLLAPRHARQAAAAADTSSSLSTSSASASPTVSSAAVMETSHSMGGGSEGGAGHLEDLLLRLQAAAAAPNVLRDPRFDGIRAVLAAAPVAGEPRRNFARSLVRPAAWWWGLHSHVQ